uniref:Dynamin N-terminal domain-containing protein n=1 Tax=Periophthalmus magnuspinnatus TaxID=409849 RepID=A0A3B4B120_9GOBI
MSLWNQEDSVRPCIDLIDSLRSLGVEQDLALPAVAVIGDQSSGKSSVLEALSGVELPRGAVRSYHATLVLFFAVLLPTEQNTTVQVFSPVKSNERMGI